jgi:hypothetical protein
VPLSTWMVLRDMLGIWTTPGASSTRSRECREYV